MMENQGVRTSMYSIIATTTRYSYTYKPTATIELMKNSVFYWRCLRFTYNIHI